MDNENIYDIDQEKIWLRILQTRRRKRALIIWLPVGIATICFISLWMYRFEKYNPPTASTSKAIQNGLRPEVVLNKTSIADLDTNLDEGIVNKNDKTKTEFNKAHIVLRETESIRTQLNNQEIELAEETDTKGIIGIPIKIKNNVVTSIEIPALPNMDAYSIIEIERSKAVKTPQIDLSIVQDTQQSKSNKRFGLELFYGRGLSKYRSNTMLSNQEANFPLGYSYDYGIAFSYYTPSDYYFSMGYVESYPQLVTEINNYAEQKGSRGRAYPSSVNLFLKLGKQNLFTTSFYYSLGFIYQCNANGGRPTFTLGQTENFPNIWTQTTVLNDIENYGLANEIGYNFQFLKQNLSVSLNYDAFLQQRIQGELRKHSDIDTYDVVGDFSSNGNTLSLRIKYVFRF